MPTDTKPRDHLVRALYADLVGPYQLDEAAIAEQELLELPPSRRFAEYFVEQVRVADKKRPQPRWRRKPKQTIEVLVPLDREVLEKGIHLKDTTGLVLEGRLQPVDKSRGVPPGTQALAIFLVNRRSAGEQGRRDVQFIFQVEMELICEEGIVARPDHTGEGSDDWDSSIADLQFRKSCEYAVGHSIAIEVPSGQEPVRRVSKGNDYLDPKLRGASRRSS